jgi:hypothetical protein
VNWIVATNKPFTVVDDPGFTELLQYTHSAQDLLHVPSATTIKRRVMDRTEEAIAAQKQVFQVCDLGKHLPFHTTNPLMLGTRIEGFDQS